MKVIISVGGRFYAFELARYFDKFGHLAQLITSYPKFEVKKYGIPAAKIKSILIKEILERGWRRTPGFLRNLYNPQYFISETFDILASRKIEPVDIFIGFSSFSLYSLRKAKKLGAIAIVEHASSHIIYQTNIIKEEYERWGMPLKNFSIAHPKVIEKELKEYEEADYVQIPSLFVKKSFLEMGFPERKLIHLPYGVDLSVFKKVPKKDDVFRVIFSGGITLRKGVHYLLQAFSELKLPNAELLLVGRVNEEMEPFLKKYSGHYRQMEYVPYKEIHEIFSQGSIFVMPSLEEGLALVQVQAMACGLPIIGATNSGAEDIVRDSVDGFIIPIRDVGMLKEKIMFFYDNPDAIKSMSDSARKRVVSGFAWEDHVLKRLDIYKEILAARH